jgi:hypothetical protein
MFLPLHVSALAGHLQAEYTIILVFVWRDGRKYNKFSEDNRVINSHFNMGPTKHERVATHSTAKLK